MYICCWCYSPAAAATNGICTTLHALNMQSPGSKLLPGGGTCCGSTATGARSRAGLLPARLIWCWQTAAVSCCLATVCARRPGAAWPRGCSSRAAVCAAADSCLRPCCMTWCCLLLTAGRRQQARALSAGCLQLGASLALVQSLLGRQWREALRARQCVWLRPESVGPASIKSAQHHCQPPLQSTPDCGWCKLLQPQIRPEEQLWTQQRQDHLRSVI